MSNTTNTEEKIITAIKTKLGSTYQVITAYDETETVDEDGTIAINIESADNMHHGTYNDYKYTISVNGQTLIDSDLSKSKINTMKSYCINNITNLSIDGLAGVVLTTVDNNSDGESNLFSIKYDMYICDATF